MWSRNKKIIKSVNLILEKRYLDNKFLNEESGDDMLPQFQVTPENFGKYKIKFTWESQNIKLPKDVRNDEFFKDEKFNELSKIYTSKEEAQKSVDLFIKKKSNLFKI